MKLSITGKIYSFNAGRRFLSNSITRHAYVGKKRTLGNTLSLDEFLFRKSVLQTYRDVIRFCYKSHEKEELIRYVRDEFKINNNEHDLVYRKYLLSSGQNKINQMIPIMGITTTKTF